MGLSIYYILGCLVTGLALVVVLSLHFRIHPFFSLLIAAFATGLALRLPADEILNAAKEGFGNIMKSLGIIIVLGTTLGLLLEHRGCTRVMADFILRRTGERHAAFAMSLTGFLVGLPVFCDSGFIVLNGLIAPLSKRSGATVLALSVSLATGLYSVHCLVPPHPGITGAASMLGTDLGKLIPAGILIALPAMLVGYGWTAIVSRKWQPSSQVPDLQATTTGPGPSVFRSFLPVVVPLLLITFRSVLNARFSHSALNTLNWLGDPVIALGIGVLLAMPPFKHWRDEKLGAALREAAEKAGGILVIIGAGGIFGAVLAAIRPGEHLKTVIEAGHLGLLFPFLITAILKTAQGSSTVAVLTAASIVNPLLPALGLTGSEGALLATLAMGAGSMVLSHANDAYFWVIVKFSGLDIGSVIKLYTPATLVMGLVSFLMVLLYAFILHN